jgi:DNA-directed RNA polymerase specialized sigma subunit
MKKDIIAMSQKERQRHHLPQMVIGGKRTLKEAGNLMGVSYRQAKRLKKKLISEIIKGPN